MTDDVLSLRAGSARALLDLADGGRLTSLTVAGLELLGGVGDVVTDYGSFVMAPWAGRIRDGQLKVGEQNHSLPTPRTHPHAGHGLVLDRPWVAISADSTRLLVRCDLDDRWPYLGYVVQHIALHPDRIEQTVQVHALEGAFPATIGWHPWFRRRLERGGEADLSFTADGMLLRDSSGMPDGTVVPVPPGPWDDCFVGVEWPMVITWPEALALHISADVPFAVIYDEKPQAFCVEPQSGPPDGPNTHPHIVTAKHPLVVSTTWAWTPID